MWLLALGIRLDRLLKGVGNKKGDFLFSHRYIMGHNVLFEEEIFFLREQKHRCYFYFLYYDWDIKLEV